MNFAHSQAPADAVVAEIGAERAVAIKADVGSVPAIKQLVADVISKYGKIDILVANAGKLYGASGLENTTEEQFDEAFAVNVKGVYFLTQVRRSSYDVFQFNISYLISGMNSLQTVAPHIPDGGRVILFSSSLTASSNVPPGCLLYNATKGAIEQMSRVLAKDLGRRSITVNTVSPGPTATDAFYVGKTEQVVKMIAAWAPANKVGEPDEIARVVAFIAGPEASWINGQNIRVNGGMTVG